MKKREKSMERTAGGGTRREDPKGKISGCSKKPRTDGDTDDDLDLDYRWGMDDPVVLPRANLVELGEEEGAAEPAEEGFYGFEQEEVEEALELQAMMRENNAERLVEDIEPEMEVPPKKKDNLSPRERKKRKAAARAR